MCRIFPSWEQISALRTPLTEGERTLAKFLDDHLPKTWNIYVQPYLNDMRPDIVVLNARVGVVVIEVKDWALDRYRFENGRMIAETQTDTWFEDDPVEKVRKYARGLYQQFLVSDEAERVIGAHPNDEVLCRAAVYFHGVSSADARALYEAYEGPVAIFGDDWLNPAHLEKIVPRAYRGTKFIRPRQTEALKDLHAWLVPPRHAIEQLATTKLSSEQAKYAIPEKGFRRIQGVAGAGKSIVLSHRAARANQEGRRVLVLSYNITMSHVLRDLLKRAPYKIDWERLHWDHFHSWARKQVVEAGIVTSTYPGLRDQATAGLYPPDHELEEADETCDDRTVRALEDIVAGRDIARGYTKPLYGGIYIDEGQDFDPRWLDALAGFLAENGELVLFADHKQNIYGRDGGRDLRRTMRRCRFSGEWARLPQKSYRLPFRVATFLNDFAHEMALDDGDILIHDYAERPPQGELGLGVVAWRNVANVEQGIESLDSVLACLGHPNPSDVVILVPNHDLGLSCVDCLSSHFQSIVHVFGKTEKESRQRKLAFWMGRGGLKMCTIHSFKGWEISNVIVIWPPEDKMKNLSSKQRAALFYTAVSRSTYNLVVVNADRDYDRFAAHEAFVA